MPTPEIFTSVINSYLPEPHASLLNGILFGVSLKASNSFYNQLKAVGLLHVIVLSGMNITLLGAIIARMTSFFSKQISILITILVIVFFIVFVGAKAPIVRAGIMGILTLVSVVFGKRYHALYALFLSGLLIAVLAPSWIISVSFQLSFMATLGIILFGSTYDSGRKKGGPRLVQELFSDFRTSLSAQVFTVPIIFYQFKQVSLISPLSNLAISLTIAPLMVFGFMTAFFGKINHWLGLIPSYICYILLEYFIRTVELLSKVPFSFIQF